MPAALVFPRITDTERSIIKTMSRDEASREIAPNVVLTKAAPAQVHLDMLATLVRSCACYYLHTGRDFDALPGLLRQVVA